MQFSDKKIMKIKNIDIKYHYISYHLLISISNETSNRLISFSRLKESSAHTHIDHHHSKLGKKKMQRSMMT